MDICLFTEDARLARRLSLLPEDYRLTDLRHAAFVIWDADSCARPMTDLPILCVTRNEKSGEDCHERLLRPFTAAALAKKLATLSGLQRFPDLSPTEKKLLSLLMEAGEAGMDKESLLRAVWGEGCDKGLVPVYICYLRKKIEHDGKKRIFSLRGKGYMYRADPLDR